MIDEKQCVPLAASKRKGAFVRGATLNTSENRRGKLQNAYDEQHNSLESKRNTTCIPFICLEEKWVQLVNFWQVCGIGGVSCFSQCVSEEDALQFLGIQMANCARPPALYDEWQEKKAHSIHCPAYLSAACRWSD